MCVSCGQVETVDHQLFACHNACRIWAEVPRIFGSNITNLTSIINCEGELANEIVNSVFLKSLIQIDRSVSIPIKSILNKALFYLNIEYTANPSPQLHNYIARINNRLLEQ